MSPPSPRPPQGPPDTPVTLAREQETRSSGVDRDPSGGMSVSPVPLWTKRFLSYRLIRKRNTWSSGTTLTPRILFYVLDSDRTPDPGPVTHMPATPTPSIVLLCTEVEVGRTRHPGSLSWNCGWSNTDYSCSPPVGMGQRPDETPTLFVRTCGSATDRVSSMHVQRRSLLVDSEWVVVHDTNVLKFNN